MFFIKLHDQESRTMPIPAAGSPLSVERPQPCPFHQTAPSIDDAMNLEDSSLVQSPDLATGYGHGSKLVTKIGTCRVVGPRHRSASQRRQSWQRTDAADGSGSH